MKASKRWLSITVENIVEGTGLIVDIMNSYGVTAAFDAGIIENADVESVKHILDSIEANGDLTIRLVGSSRPETQEEYLTAVDTADLWRRWDANAQAATCSSSAISSSLRA